MVFTKFRAQVGEGVVEEGTIIDGVKKSTIRSTKRRRRGTAQTTKAPTETPIKEEIISRSTGPISKTAQRERTFNVLTLQEQKKGLEGLSQKLSFERQKIRTDISRKPGFKPRREARLGLATAGQTITDTALGVKQILQSIPKAPKGIINITKDPKTFIKDTKEFSITLPKKIKAGGEEAGRISRISLTEAIVFIAGEILLLKGSGKVFKVIGKATPSAKLNLSPKLKKVKPSNVIFVGSQEEKGGKIISKIAFRTDEGKIGRAVGITSQKGETFRSVTVGKTARLKKGKGKTRLKDKEVFIGVEKGISKPGTQKLISDVKIKQLRKRKSLRKDRKLKELTPVNLRILRNLEGISQASIGRTAQARGKKLLRKVPRFDDPRGFTVKKADKLKLKSFVSVSSVLTKGDLSLIIGKTLTSEKDVIRFVGLIRGKKNIAKEFKLLSPKKRLLFKRALNDVAGVVTASSKSSKKIIPKLSPRARIEIKKTSLTITTPRAKLTIKKKPLTKVRSEKLKARSKSFQRSALTVRQIGRIKSRSKQLTGLVSKQTAIQKEVLKTKQRQKLKTRQRQKLKQKALTKPGARIRAIPIIAPTVKIPGKIKTGLRGKRTGAVKRFKQGYDVFGKSKGKFIKLNVKPLSRKDALSRGAFAIDKSTARTFKIKKMGKKVKKLGSIKKKERNYISIADRKLRRFRKSKGKRISLKNKFIEKKKHLIDTRGEIKGLTLAKLIKREGFKGPKRKTKLKTQAQVLKKFNRRLDFKGFPKRARSGRSNPFKKSISQREVMLSNLRKGREKRLNNLKRNK